MLYKRRMERELLRAKGLLAEAEKPPGEEDGPPRPAGGMPAVPKSGSYVPPSVRNRAAGTSMGEGDSMHKRRDENSLRCAHGQPGSGMGSSRCRQPGWQRAGPCWRQMLWERGHSVAAQCS